jgi:hypothetical protein
VESTAHEAVGHSGHVQLLTDRIRILRPGVMAGLSGNMDRELAFTQIQLVEFRDAGRHVNGWIRFIAHGDRPTPVPTSHLVVDPYTVFFTYNQRPEFVALRDEVKRRVASLATSANGRSQDSPPTH